MIAKRFEQQAARHATRTALRVGGVDVVYDDLNRSANRIAHAVAASIERQQTPIAICTHEIDHAVAAILGTLKSRNLCVPLDGGAPAARQSAIVEHAGAGAVLTTQASLPIARKAAGRSCPVLAVDDLDSSPGDSNPGIEISGDDLACLIYTSGSTGAPKGVIHDHLNLLAACDCWSERFDYGERDRFVHVSPLSHISAINDILKPLLSGGCMVPLRLTAANPGRLAALVVREGITVYHSIPSVFRAMVHALAPDASTALRLVHLGGEPLFRTDVELFRRRFPRSCVLVNNLGSTEVPSFLQNVIEPDAELDSSIVPVGYPAKGKRIRLVDGKGAEVPAGEVGEIVVQSAFVARGYWNDPDGTVARFSGDLDEREERTFRTGDLGRRRPDGAVEFFGRGDDQIKVRGHRVEIGEVQFALLEAARATGGIGETTVAPGEAPSGAASVVAYVTPQGSSPIDLDGLRARMDDRLPRAMRPEAYVVLDSLPKTSTGKIDRPALPPVARPAGAASAGGQRARSLMTRQMEHLWKQMLRVDRVADDDDFFDLGGDSLLALELTTEIERIFGRSVSLPELADASTLDAMVRLIEDRSRARVAPCLVPLQPDGAKVPLFLVHGMGGGVIEMRPLARGLDPDRPVFVFQARGVDGVSRPLKRIESMAAAYLAELRRVRPEGPYLLGGFSMGGIVAYEMAQRLTAAGEQPAALVLIDTGAPLPIPWTEWLTDSFAYGKLIMRRLRRRGVSRRRRRRGYVRSINRVMALNFRAAHRYRPEVYAGDVHLLASRRDEMAAAADEQERALIAQLEQRLVRRRDKWDALLPGGVVVHDIPGHHLELFRPPALDGLIAALRTVVDSACGDHTETPTRSRTNAYSNASSRMRS